MVGLLLPATTANKELVIINCNVIKFIMDMIWVRKFHELSISDRQDYTMSLVIGLPVMPLVLGVLFRLSINILEYKVC